MKSINKEKRIVSQLLSKTEAGKIKWYNFNVDENRFLTYLPSFSLSIRKSRIPITERMYLRILDKSGNLLTEIEESGDEMDLRPLYEVARRNALEVDLQLQGLLDELDTLE